MLEIVKFIKEHDNWRELLSSDPYNLKIAEDDGFVILSYSQINSDFNEEICKEARGLILDMQNDFKVVRMAFKKFFNLGEGFASNIDWDSAVATEKIVTLLPDVNLHPDVSMLPDVNLHPDVTLSIRHLAFLLANLSPLKLHQGCMGPTWDPLHKKHIT